MKKSGRKTIIPFAILVFLASSTPAMAKGVKVAYLYTLANFTGDIPYNWAKISVDKMRKEIYRGEPLSKIEFRNLPSQFSEFSPDRIIYENDRLYLADRKAMRVMVTDPRRLIYKGYDIVSLHNEPTGKKNMDAAFNYKLLYHWPGANAHNRHFTKRLIFDSIDWLDNNTLDGTIELSSYTEAEAYFRSTDPVDALTRL